MSCDLVKQHLFPIPVPDAVEDLTRLPRPCASREERPAQRFVAEPLSGTVEPDGLGRFHGREDHRGMASHVSSSCDFDLCAHAHGHSDT